LYTVYVIYVLFTGEAGVPFFHSCGSDFDELYVGTLTLLHLYTVYVIYVLFTGEAGVPFFHSCGSDFDELYVGTGAAKVKKLFGKKYKNYIIILIA